MVYTVSLAFLTITFLYSITLNIIFFSKTHIDTEETKIFGQMLMTNLIGIMLEIVCIIFLNIYGKDSIIAIVINKFFLVYFITILYLFSNYIINTSYLLGEKKDQRINERLKLATKIVYGISAIVVLFLKIELFNENGISYSYGPAVNLVYVMSALTSLSSFVHLLVNFKTIKNRKNIPIIVFLLLMGVTAAIQMIYPQITLATSVEALVIFLMYHTIENPDVKLAKELSFQKQVAEASSKKTLELLEDMSKDLNSSLSKLELFGNKKIDKNNIEELYREISDFQQESIKLNERISGVLDLATIKGTTEIKEDKYETYDMLDKLKQLLITDKEKVGNLKVNISSDMPSVLYGDDSSVIKIVLYFYNYISSIIHDDKLLLDISSLQVGRFSRLKFKFATSDLSINKHIIEDRNTERLVFSNSDNINYQIIDNLIKKFNGKITIIEKESTTTIELSVDQRTLTEYDIISNRIENKNIEIKYNDFSGKRILIVDNNSVKIKDIKTLLKPYNVDIVSTDNQSHMCEILSKDEIFDLILIDDIIPDFEYSDYTNEIVKSKDGILNHIKITAKYPITTVIMLNPSTNHNEKEYLDYGFDDYILKPINKEKIDKLLKKHLNK